MNNILVTTPTYIVLFNYFNYYNSIILHIIMFTLVYISHSRVDINELDC